MTTRGELFTQVVAYTRRSGDTDFTAAWPTMLRNVEERLKEEIVHSRQVTVTTLDFTGESAALPDDCLSIRSISNQAGRGCRILEYVSPQVFREGVVRSSGSQPQVYTIENRSVYIKPGATTSLDLSYYAAFAPMVADTDTTALLQNHFHLYLQAALYEAYTFLQDDQQALQANARYADIRNRLMEQDDTFRHSGSSKRKIGSRRRV